MNDHLKDILNSIFDDLLLIKRNNEVGYCNDIADDIASLLSSRNIPYRKLCIYNSDEDLGFVDDSEIYCNPKLHCFLLKELGSVELYIVHYAVIVDGFVIDLNREKNIKSYNDVVFDYQEYKSDLLYLNKNFSNESFKFRFSK